MSHSGDWHCAVMRVFLWASVHKRVELPCVEQGLEDCLDASTWLTPDGLWTTADTVPVTDATVMASTPLINAACAIRVVRGARQAGLLVCGGRPAGRRHGRNKRATPAAARPARQGRREQARSPDPS